MVLLYHSAFAFAILPNTAFRRWLCAVTAESIPKHLGVISSDLWHSHPTLENSPPPVVMKTSSVFLTARGNACTVTSRRTVSFLGRIESWAGFRSRQRAHWSATSYT